MLARFWIGGLIGVGGVSCCCGFPNSLLLAMFGESADGKAWGFFEGMMAVGVGTGLPLLALLTVTMMGFALTEMFPPPPQPSED